MGVYHVVRCWQNPKNLAGCRPPAHRFHQPISADKRPTKGATPWVIPASPTLFATLVGHAPELHLSMGMVLVKAGLR
jgi:hypothetical protein